MVKSSDLRQCLVVVLVLSLFIGGVLITALIYALNEFGAIGTLEDPAHKNPVRHLSLSPPNDRFKLTLLIPQGMVESEVIALNDDNHALIKTYASGEKVRNYLWRSDGDAVRVGADDLSVAARDLNNLGEVIGNASSANVAETVFIWSATNGITTIDYSILRDEAGVQTCPKGLYLTDNGKVVLYSDDTSWPPKREWEKLPRPRTFIGDLEYDDSSQKYVLVNRQRDEDYHLLGVKKITKSGWYLPERSSQAEAIRLNLTNGETSFNFPYRERVLDPISDLIEFVDVADISKANHAAGFYEARSFHGLAHYGKNWVRAGRFVWSATDGMDLFDIAIDDNTLRLKVEQINDQQTLVMSDGAKQYFLVAGDKAVALSEINPFGRKFKIANIVELNESGAVAGNAILDGKRVGFLIEPKPEAN